jgi:hypothetical protein
MREDVLEPIVDDYLKFKGCFTMHNLGVGIVAPRGSNRIY